MQTGDSEKAICATPMPNLRAIAGTAGAKICCYMSPTATAATSVNSNRRERAGRGWVCSVMSVLAALCTGIPHPLAPLAALSCKESGSERHHLVPSHLVGEG